MATRTEAIKSFLTKVTHEDLSELYGLNMECQVTVAQGEGERITGEYHGITWSGYTDQINTWKPFRIPYNAASKPEYDDREMAYDLSAHAEGIGMTGWNWKDLQSEWVAYDFDAIIGHSESHTAKISTDEITRVREAACQIPWVTVRHSTGGRGLHLYVFLKDCSTNNHTEHAALARAILSKMSALAGYDFNSKVDICGGNMWVWHRKLKNNPNGLRMIKKGTVLKDIPKNWRDHVEVVRGGRSKVRYKFGVSELEEKFEQSAGQRNKIKLDEGHQQLIKWLNDTSTKTWWWDADHHMLITHTLDLKAAYDELGLRGIFKTSSSGTTEQNCFAFPMRRGAWAIRRYSLGCSEDLSWEQDGQGWTKCYLNKEPDLRTASGAHGGVEHAKGGYLFEDGDALIHAASAIGAEVTLPSGAMRRTDMKMKPHKDGRRVVVEVPLESHDNSSDFKNWYKEGKRWVRIFTANMTAESEIDTNDLDDVVRHVITPDECDAGWLVRSGGYWRREPLTHTRMFIESMGYSPPETKHILGGSIYQPWKLVTHPFEPEYVGDRQWNRQAPQLLYVPSVEEKLSYPHWLKILEHIGSGFDLAVRDNDWCKNNGILTGADYLKCWVACLFQYPQQPLPYLFIFSERQATGKSIFHEALKLLFEPGYRRADQALTNPSAFNGELEGAILCVVEETDLSTNNMAYNRIKDWVTSPILPIHRKGLTPYHVLNTTHWIQCSNIRTACPVLTGDTRIVAINVPELPEVTIPKGALLEQLKKEAEDFLGEVIRLEVPSCDDRLRMPAIDTQAKRDVSQGNKSSLLIFLEEQCYEIPGAITTLSDFYTRFQAWLEPNERFKWASKQKVSGGMPERIVKGRNPTNAQWCWGNLSLFADTEHGEKLIVHNDRLVEK